MILTTGTEWTTAVTDLVNAIAVLIPFVWLLAAILILILANVLQSIKSIQFTVIWPFNYNAVYHFVLLVFIFVQFRAIRIAIEEDRK